jgi:AraC family transcriptional regulator, ethanolamine operon transcriptional activator
MAKPCCAKQPSLEQFVSGVQGFRLELLQIDQGAFRAAGFQAHLGEGLIGTARFGRALVQTWTSPARSITIAVRTSRASALWRGASFGPSDLLIAGPATAIELASQPGFGAASVSFPEHEFQRTAQAHGCGSILDETKCILLRLPKAAAPRDVQTAIRSLISEISAHHSEPRDPKWEQDRRDELLYSMILLASGGIPFQPSTHNAERTQILERAVFAIKQRPADVLTVAALGRIVGASQRTLHYAFVERYGLPPARFMRVWRLHGARKELGQVHSQELKISDVANKWGFWHLGQFAKDYRLWFGELPSETCRRTQAEI